MKDNYIFLRAVQANITYLFDPLDVQGKFCEGYSTQALDTGKELDEIEVPLKLSILKPLKCYIEMYNHMTEDDGRKICRKGWEVAGIKEAVQKGLSGLPNFGPISDIDPFTENDVKLY